MILNIYAWEILLIRFWDGFLIPFLYLPLVFYFDTLEFICAYQVFLKKHMDSCHILTTYNQPKAVLLKLLLTPREMEEKHLVCVLGNSYKQSCQAKLWAVFHIKAGIYFNKVHRDTQK